MAKSFLSNIPDNDTPHTFAKWQELRKANPRIYYSSEVQNRIAKDIDTLGSEKFFGKEGGQS